MFLYEMHKKHGLSSNFKGPFRVHKRFPKYYEIDFGNKIDSVALHRIKAAHLLPSVEEELVLHRTKNNPQPQHNPQNNPPQPPQTQKNPTQPPQPPNKPPQPPQPQNNPPNPSQPLNNPTNIPQTQNISPNNPQNNIPQPAEIGLQPNMDNQQSPVVSQNEQAPKRHSVMRRLANFNKPGLNEQMPHDRSERRARARNQSHN